MGESKSPKEEYYFKQEYDCESNLTDADMIRLHIGISLSLTEWDKDLFLKLMGQLKEEMN